MADVVRICGLGERYPALAPPRRYLSWLTAQQWASLQACRVRIG